jgi:death-associated protein kinase
MRCSISSLAVFQLLCTVPTRVRFLTRVGELIWFGDDESLADTIVMDPRWLCTTVLGPILSPDNFPLQTVARRKGVVAVGDLDAVYRGLDVGMVLAVLQRLELCFPLLAAVDEEATEYMFPATLCPTDQRSVDVWAATEEYTTYFGRRFLCESEVDMFSAGFFPRFQVCVT